MKELRSRIKSEKGVMIVEATIVFPVMFLVIFLMLTAGNAYLQKCKVESFANQLALDGAAYCADPLLQSVEGGKIPNAASLHVKPYRYFIGGMDDTVSEMSDKATEDIENMHTGLFSGMRPKSKGISVSFNNQYIYSTFRVSFSYEIKMPVRLLFARDNIKMQFKTCADVPISDSMEFIRNVDMIDDYLETSGVKGKIEDVINKAKEWFKR